MKNDKKIDELFNKLLKTHKEICPEHSFFDIWNNMNEQFRKVKYQDITNDRFLLLFKMASFDLSLDYSNEEWLPIKGYEEIYDVSNMGRIRRRHRNGYRFMHYDIGNYGYKRVNLSKNNKAKRFLVHRLVAEAFIPNNNNYPIVNHKDENPWNNTVENLEWCTYSYNNQYNGITEKRFATRSRNIFAKKINMGSPVIQLSIDGEYIKEWQNAEWAYRELGISSSSISKVCHHEKHCHTAGGYRWLYKSEYEKRHDGEQNEE